MIQKKKSCHYGHRLIISDLEFSKTSRDALFLCTSLNFCKYIVLCIIDQLYKFHEKIYNNSLLNRAFKYLRMSVWPQSEPNGLIFESSGATGYTNVYAKF